MTTDNVEITKNALVELNEQVAEMEQRGEAAKQFFQTHLSERLIFRRASGKVVGKSGPDGFLEGLKNNPFTMRVPEDIAATVLEDGRALVTFGYRWHTQGRRLRPSLSQHSVVSHAPATIGLWSSCTTMRLHAREWKNNEHTE